MTSIAVQITSMGVGLNIIRQQGRVSLFLLFVAAAELPVMAPVAHAQPANDAVTQELDNNKSTASFSEQFTTEVINPVKTRVGRYVAAKSKAFSESDIVFSRAPSNLPFLPLSYLGVSHYDEAVIDEYRQTDKQVRYRQKSSTFATGLPFLLNSTDAAILGVYANRSDFRVDRDLGAMEDASADRFRVTSLGLAGAYFSQLNDDWQFLGFVMPFYQDSDLEGGSPYWQTLSGAFGRYSRSEDLWWAFGVFADSSPFESYVLPYVGFNWVIDPEWSVSAILPWPAITWAPSKNYFWSLGATYSGSGWALDRSSGTVGMNVNAFDFGLSFQHRVYGSLWGSISAGVSGLRMLEIENGSDIEGPDFDTSSSPFIRLDLTIRPGDLLL